ncbi:MAG: hypothetical protein ACJ70O_01215 [Nitrososphaera sp.]
MQKAAVAAAVFMSTRSCNSAQGIRSLLSTPKKNILAVEEQAHL